MMENEKLPFFFLLEPVKKGTTVYYETNIRNQCVKTGT